MHISGLARSKAGLLGGFGLRLVECVRLREKEKTSIEQIQTIVRRDKEIQGRTTMFPEQLGSKLSDPMEKSR